MDNCMQTMKKYICLFVFLPLFWACNPEQVYTTRDVQLTMKMKQLSAGFVEYEYSTNKDAYYAIGVVACDELNHIEDPLKAEEQFKNLVLDEYYMNYIIWRHDLLMEGTPYIASYASHSLFYGKTDYYHVFLRPHTDYWAFAFVVDPETNKPAGPLVLERITTKEISSIPVRFEYRVHGTWDYAYPIDSLGRILSTFPYMSSTRSKEYLVEWVMNEYGDTSSAAMHTPAAYFIDTLRSEIAQAEHRSRVLYGEFAYNNVDEFDEPTFEVGKVYYTAFAGCDGDFNNKQAAIYRFTWMGDTTRVEYTELDKLSAFEW